MGSSRLPCNWPSVVKGGDPLAVLTEQHDVLRDVLDRLPRALDDQGRGDPIEGRVLWAMLQRALRWHRADEEAVLLPRLSGLGATLEGMGASCKDFHEAIEDAALEVCDLTGALCRGEGCDPVAWREACEGLRRALEPAMVFEDEELFPAVRVVLEADDREDIAALLRARIEARPELSELICPPTAPHRVSSVSVLRSGGAPDLVHRYVEYRSDRPGSTDRGDEGLGAFGPSPGAFRVGDVMTRSVRCVTPEVALAALVKLLDDAGISGVPVVDELGRVLGVVSQTDVVRTLATAGTLEGRRVADAMMRVPFCVDERASVDDAAALLAYEGVHRLPVVNAQREVVGIVSALDLVRLRGEQVGGRDTSRA